MLRHWVQFQFTDSSTADDVQRIVDAFCSLKDTIPGVFALEHGTNNSPEGLADGFTHCFLLTFQNEEDRDAYLPHPKHQAFIEIVKPHVHKVQVFDYWVSESL